MRITPALFATSTALSTFKPPHAQEMPLDDGISSTRLRRLQAPSRPR